MKKFAEFFAGVGLVREGLEPSNWSCIWANDICPDKRETYASNYGDEHFFLGDVWDVVLEEDSIPDDTFLYTASFPCTDLSVAGGRAGLAGKSSGTLNAVIEILRKKKNRGSHPQVVLLENVRGFLMSHQGRDIQYTLNALSELGYYVDLLELDAIYFTPQSRPRVFIIAVQEGLAKETMVVKENDSIFDRWWSHFDRYPEVRSKRVKDIVLKNPDISWGLVDFSWDLRASHDLADIIEKDISPDDSRWWNVERQEHLYSQMKQDHKSILHEMMARSELSYGTVYRRMRKGESRAELRTDGSAGCLRTPRGGSSKQILVQAGFGGWGVRLLTPREYARLQGVRDTFKLPVNANKGYFAMGDAVCVPVIEFITNNILDPIYDVFITSECNCNKEHLGCELDPLLEH